MSGWDGMECAATADVVTKVGGGSLAVLSVTTPTSSIYLLPCQGMTLLVGRAMPSGARDTMRR